MKYRTFWLVLVAVCVVMAVVGAWVAMSPPTPGVTKSNFDRIEAGMTRPEVETVLSTGTETVLSNEWKERWMGRNGNTIVIYYKEEKVIDKEWITLSVADRIQFLFPWFGLD